MLAKERRILLFSAFVLFTRHQRPPFQTPFGHLAAVQEKSLAESSLLSLRTEL